ncbi:MAG: 30S ribosomal protein S17e [Candidatus Pacearchaeota archaeon]
MGRIKPLMVKRTTKELMTKDLPFSGEFSNNKVMLGTTMPSKKVRNKIAGYIARLHRAKEASAKSEESKVVAVASTQY